MSSLKDIVAEQQLSRRAEDDPLFSALLAELLIQAEEVCVLRDRLDTCELLIREGRSPTADAIDVYQPSPEIVAERLARHREHFVQAFERLSDAGR
ncbi:MAG: hypothetical protein AAFX56_15065 [Pseudomonadota bacterium]